MDLETSQAQIRQMDARIQQLTEDRDLQQREQELDDHWITDEGELRRQVRVLNAEKNGDLQQKAEISKQMETLNKEIER